MNIQVFGVKKCFDTKSAQRFFKERGIKFQFIDLTEKEISKKELLSVVESVKDIDLLFNEKSPLYESLNVKYIMRSREDKIELLLTNQGLIKTPLVRDTESRQATVGNAQAVWKTWVKK